MEKKRKKGAWTGRGKMKEEEGKGKMGHLLGRVDVGLTHFLLFLSLLLHLVQCSTSSNFSSN